MEYPKMLYRGDEHVTVKDIAEEEDQRSQGFAMFGEEPEEAPKRRGRPPKGE